MPEQVINLRDIIATAKANLARTPVAAAKLGSAVQDLSNVLGEVEQFADEIKRDTASAKAMLGSVTNTPPDADKVKADTEAEKARNKPGVTVDQVVQDLKAELADAKQAGNAPPAGLNGTGSGATTQGQ